MKTLTLDYRQLRSSRLSIQFNDSLPNEAEAKSAAVLARGRALASDPSYPSFDICKKVASAWLGSLPVGAA